MKASVSKPIVNVFKSVLLSFILTLVLIVVVSILLTLTSLKEGTIPLLNTIIMVIGIAAGSIYMGIHAEENGWLNGGIIGILYFLILLLINFLFIKPFIFTIYTIGKLIICLIVGAIGGMIGVNIK